MIAGNNMIIQCLGTTNDPLSVLAGNKATGLVDLRPPNTLPIPGDGHLWNITDKGDYHFTIENAGKTGDPLSFLAGNKATGLVDLRPPNTLPIPGDGHLWNINDVGNFKFTIKNAGTTDDPLSFLAGNKATGLVDLRPPNTLPIPGDGHLWSITPYVVFYTAVFENIQILATRSLHTDTDFANIAVQVDDQLYTVATKPLGNLNNGLHGVDLRINNIPIPYNAKKVKIGISVMNSGHVNLGPIGDVVIGLVSSGADAIIPGSGEFIALVCKVLDIASFINPDCDGPVVAAATTANPKLLLRSPIGQKLYYLSGDDFGYKSSGGCGDNSKYHYAAYLRRTA